MGEGEIDCSSSIGGKEMSNAGGLSSCSVPPKSVGKQVTERSTQEGHTRATGSAEGQD